MAGSYVRVSSIVPSVVTEGWKLRLKVATQAVSSNTQVGETASLYATDATVPSVSTTTSSDNKKIEVFCVGQHTAVVKSLQIGDTLTITNARVGDSAGGEFPYRIIVEGPRASMKPSGLFGPPTGSTTTLNNTSTTTTTTTTNPNSVFLRASTLPKPTFSGMSGGSSNNYMGVGSGSGASREAASASVLNGQPWKFRKTNSGNRAAITAPKGKGSSAEKEYTKLADVKIGGKHNVFAVVSNFKPPRKTRGSDMVMTLTLVDETNYEGGGVSCNLFHPNLSDFPPVSACGDVVRVHRLGFQRHRGEMQGLSNRSTSYVTASGVLNAPVVPPTHYNCTWLHSDNERVNELREWFHALSSGNGAATALAAGKYDKTLATVPMEGHFDIVCQVDSITPPKSPGDMYTLAVWDGTTPNMQLALPLANGTRLSARVTAEVVDGEAVRVGVWVRLRNVICVAEPHLPRIPCEGGGVDGSGLMAYSIRVFRTAFIIPVYKNSPEVQLRVREYAQAKKQKCFVVDEMRGLQTCSVEDALNNLMTPNILRVSGYVWGITPNDVDGIVRRVCGNCKSNVPAVWMYLFTIQLSDTPRLQSTGGPVLDVIVAEVDAERFLGEEACDLSVHTQTRERVQRKLSALAAQKSKADVVVSVFATSSDNVARHRLADTVLRV